MHGATSRRTEKLQEALSDDVTIDGLHCAVCSVQCAVCSLQARAGLGLRLRLRLKVELRLGLQLERKISRPPRR